MRDHRIQCYAMLLFGVAVLITNAREGVAQTGGSPPSLGSSMPSDIDLQSGFRLPLPRRDDLDEAGKRAFDQGNTPGASVAGLQGPAGIQLYSTKTAEHLTAVNRYLRFGAGISAK